MANEADIKRDIIKRIKDEGGYGRRFEDQFSVGFPDTILIPKGGPVFFCEVKIIRAQKFGATPRQFEELKRIGEADGGSLVAIPILVGYGGNTKRLYCVRPTVHGSPVDAIYAERPWNITEMLLQYLADYKLKRLSE